MTFTAEDEGCPVTSVVVTGATSQIGRFLLPRLQSGQASVLAVSRSTQDSDHAGHRWLQGDLSQPIDWPGDSQGFALLHLAPLPLLVRHFEALRRCNVRRVVAFSSTSRLSKANSPDRRERDQALALADAEQALAEWGRNTGVSWTVFRPTMIYGAGIDRNVSFVAWFVRHFRFYPLVGGGTGLRQPVHADDLACACLSVLCNPATYGSTYELGGGERLTYRELVERVFSGLSLRPRLVPVPMLLLRMAVQLLSLLPRYSHLTAEMVNRMNLDLCFDTTAAARDFGFAPRPFSFTSSLT